MKGRCCGVVERLASYRETGGSNSSGRLALIHFFTSARRLAASLNISAAFLVGHGPSNVVAAHVTLLAKAIKSINEFLARRRCEL